MPAILLLDANILVKDFVAETLYDLHGAGLVTLYWTPEIEAEYIEHRARRRMEKRGGTEAENIRWARKRMESYKTNIVHSPTPPGWIPQLTIGSFGMESVCREMADAITDKDDIHVAAAAVFLATKMARPVILITADMNDFNVAADEALGKYNVLLMHPGVFIEMLVDNQKTIIATIASLEKTAADWKNPELGKSGMLEVLALKDHMANIDLARKVATHWGMLTADTATIPGKDPKNTDV